MTVKELILELQKYPQDLVVVDYTGRLETEDVRMLDEYYDGDCANPNCPVIKALEII